MIRRTKPRGWDPSPPEFNRLAIYNSHVANGTAEDRYSPDDIAEMAELQVEFDAWREWQLRRQGFKPSEDFPGYWIREGEPES
jgi:L-amino acid N-acyltransferase YncA